MPTTESSARSTFLSILLLSVFIAAVFIACLGLLGEAFLLAIAIVAVIGGVGLSHYLLWGRSMEREVEVERAEALSEEDEPPPETNGWPTDERFGPRRF
jgi:hypothetical protein